MITQEEAIEQFERVRAHASTREHLHSHYTKRARRHRVDVRVVSTRNGVCVHLGFAIGQAGQDGAPLWFWAEAVVLGDDPQATTVHYTRDHESPIVAYNALMADMLGPCVTFAQLYGLEHL